MMLIFDCDIRNSQSIMNQEMMTEYLFREVDRKSSIDFYNESVMSRHHNPIPKVDFLLYREDVLLVI